MSATVVGMRIRVAGVAAAIAIAALALPGTAHAQYTLTFDLVGGIGNPCTASFGDYCTVNSGYGSESGTNGSGAWAVTATNGFSTTLGGSIVSGSSLGISDGNYSGESGPPNYDASVNNPYPAQGYGMFDFTTSGAIDALTLDSLRVGLIGSPSVPVYDDIYVYSNSNVLLVKDSVLISSGSTSYLVGPNVLSAAAAIQGGFKLYFGEAPSSFAADPINSSYFTVDDITYETAAYTPEPGTILLLGTGLTLLLPVVRRRRA